MGVNNKEPTLYIKGLTLGWGLSIERSYPKVDVGQIWKQYLKLFKKNYAHLWKLKDCVDISCLLQIRYWPVSGIFYIGSFYPTTYRDYSGNLSWWAEISRGHKLAGGMGAAEAAIGVQGQRPSMGARRALAENEFKHFWAQKMTSPGSCCCYLRLQFWGRISINCAAQLINTSFLPIFQLSTIVTYCESSLGHLPAVWKHFKSFTINSCDLVDLYYNHWTDTNYLKVSV